MTRSPSPVAPVECDSDRVVVPGAGVRRPIECRAIDGWRPGVVLDLNARRRARRCRACTSSLRASDRDGVSLNQFITGVLASAVGWRREDGTEITPPGEQKLRSRRMTMLLVANVILVGLAALAAIAFLIAAWLS
jgi:hypothetical protein